MNSQDLIKAIKHIRPNAEFTFKNGDYSTIEWIVLEGDAPTEAELQAANLEVKTAEEAAIAEAEAKREIALAKLAGLGLEPDDLKALGL